MMVLEMMLITILDNTKTGQDWLVIYGRNVTPLI